jgi:hypothetical protein
MTKPDYRTTVNPELCACPISVLQVARNKSQLGTLNEDYGSLRRPASPVHGASAGGFILGSATLASRELFVALRWKRFRRGILIEQHELPKNRGRYYNHSGFADLVITGLIGLRSAPGNSFWVHPLIRPGKWDYFALDGLPYHGHVWTIFYDRDGTRYGKGAGLNALCGGVEIARSEKLQALAVDIPAGNAAVERSR